MKNILVLGGTQFFGLKAVNRLIENGHEVTIATRGNKPHPFGNKVDHIILDARDRSHEGWDQVTAQSWDAVFNNILYTKEDAELMVEKFADLTDDFYFTSTMSVYLGPQFDYKDGYVETDFEPTTFEVDPAVEVNYGEGKRQAETVLFNDVPFNVTAFRFPIVLDHDDYTKRLHFYIERALNNETIYLENKDYKINFVKGTTAAESIVWAIENKQSGIYNISAKDAVPLEMVMEWIAEGTGKQLHVEYTGEQVQDSPFSLSYHQYLVPNKIIDAGFEGVTNLGEWLRPLIKDISKDMA